VEPRRPMYRDASPRPPSPPDAWFPRIR
jgi:hypothetical protein